MRAAKILGIAFLVILVQWMLIQDLPLTQYGNPYLYLWAFLIIPFNTPRSTTYILAFLIGSTLDSLEQSGGAHTIASLIMVIVKPTLENFFYGFKEENSDHTLGGLPLVNFLPLTFLLVLIHHSLLFTVENSGFSQFTALGLRILMSTLSTAGLLTITHFLLSKRYAA
jgi:hypothetical protein